MRIRVCFPIIGIILFFLACAKQGFPPGGPEDRTPPSILRTLPQSGQTDVDSRTGIRVWFSERIRPNTVENAVFITPRPDSPVRIRCRGSRVDLVMTEPLRPERTYVVTFGSGIKDYRNNAMRESFTLAFSTGSKLDQGEIAGYVVGIEDARGIGVWAYRLDNSESPDPGRTEAEYIVQCGTRGHFRMTHLSPGLYRLFAVRDRSSDLLYQPGSDEIGMAAADVRSEEGDSLSRPTFFFKMAREDTLSPSVVRVIAEDNRSLTVRFNRVLPEEWDWRSQSSPQLFARDDAIRFLTIDEAYTDPTNPLLLHVRTKEPMDERSWTLQMAWPLDPDSSNSGILILETVFQGRLDPDTTRPCLIAAHPEPNDREAFPDSALVLTFSEPVAWQEGETDSLVQDSLRRSIPGILTSPSPARVVFRPREVFSGRALIRVNARGRLFRDRAGNALKDTVFSFRTIDRDTLSEISGTFSCPEDVSAFGVVVKAQHARDSNRTYFCRMPAAGAFRFTGVMPGPYLLEAFIDRDGNGRFDSGKPYPWRPSEPLAVYADTVAVRSRWPNEGNDFQWP